MDLQSASQLWHVSPPPADWQMPSPQTQDPQSSGQVSQSSPASRRLLPHMMLQPFRFGDPQSSRHEQCSPSSQTPSPQDGPPVGSESGSSGSTMQTGTGLLQFTESVPLTHVQELIAAGTTTAPCTLPCTHICPCTRGDTRPA